MALCVSPYRIFSRNVSSLADSQARVKKWRQFYVHVISLCERNTYVLYLFCRTLCFDKFSFRNFLIVHRFRPVFFRISFFHLAKFVELSNVYIWTETNCYLRFTRSITFLITALRQCSAKADFANSARSQTRRSCIYNSAREFSAWFLHTTDYFTRVFVRESVSALLIAFLLSHNFLCIRCSLRKRPKK